MHRVVLVNFAQERKEETPLFKQTLKATLRIIKSLRVVFGLSTLIANWILFHKLCKTEYPASGALEHD